MAATQPGEFNIQEFTDLGILMIGGRLYTYLYGTTTLKIAYTDAAGAVPHTYTSDGLGGQFIALNARGELPAPLYLTTGSYDLALKRPDGSTVWTRRADPTGDVTISAPSLANIGAGTTTLVGSQAGLIQVDASAGNVIINLPQASVATGATFQFKRIDSTTNTVTINRAGADTIDGATSYVLSGIFSLKELRSDGVSAWRRVGDVGPSAGSNMASAATLDLTTRNGRVVRITGTTPITSIIMGNGDEVYVVAVGALPFNIPGLLIRTCTAGTVLRFMQDGNGTQTASIVSGPAMAHGCCRLTKSGVNLLLSPFNGNTIVINGQIITIPSAGVTLGSAGSGSTLYYIYAFLSSGVLTLERSTTGHSTDTTTGVEIKTGDPTRTLVGMAQSGSNNWLDDTQFRYTLSYFNRRELFCSRFFTATRTTTLGGYANLNPEIICYWLTWADELVKFSAMGQVSNSGAFATDSTIAVDSTVQEAYSSNATGPSPIGISCSNNFTEGAHTSDLFGRVAGGTGSWFGSGTAGSRTVLQTIVMG